MSNSEPALARQRRLTVERVIMDGVRYNPHRVLAMQLLAHGGLASTSVRALSEAMDVGENSVGTLINFMIGDGLAKRVGTHPTRTRAGLYTITDEGRRVLRKLTAIIDADPDALPVLDLREARVLEAVGQRSMNLPKFADVIGLGPQATRRLLAGMAHRRLMRRLDRKQFGHWKASSLGRKALAAARSGA